MNDTERCLMCAELFPNCKCQYGRNAGNLEPPDENEGIYDQYEVADDQDTQGDERR